MNFFQKKLVEGKSETEVPTMKGGEFHKKDGKDFPEAVYPKDDKGNYEKITVDIVAKLLKPKGISVAGTFTFNGVKRSFAAKTGDKKDLGELVILKPGKITISIDGETDPAQPDGTKLLFETETTVVD